jgi:hypothetical protein
MGCPKSSTLGWGVLRRLCEGLGAMSAFGAAKLQALEGLLPKTRGFAPPCRRALEFSLRENSPGEDEAQLRLRPAPVPGTSRAPPQFVFTMYVTG